MRFPPPPLPFLLFLFPSFLPPWASPPPLPITSNYKPQPSQHQTTQRTTHRTSRAAHAQKSHTPRPSAPQRCSRAPASACSQTTRSTRAYAQRTTRKRVVVVAVVVAPALAVAVVAWATPAPAVSMLVPLVRAVTKSRGREVTVAGPTYFSRRIGGLGFKWSLYLSCTLILSFDFAPSSACSFLRHLVMTGTRNDGQGQNIIHSYILYMSPLLRPSLTLKREHRQKEVRGGIDPSVIHIISSGLISRRDYQLWACAYGIKQCSRQEEAGSGGDHVGRRLRICVMYNMDMRLETRGKPVTFMR